VTATSPNHRVPAGAIRTVSCSPTTNDSSVKIRENVCPTARFHVHGTGTRGLRRPALSIQS